MAKKTTTTGATPNAGNANTGTVTVKVLIASLGEEGVTFAKGQTFDTTAERASALGAAVEIVAAVNAD